MSNTDRGVALIEVLAAILLLAVAGLALADLVGEELRSVAADRRRETALADEERLLGALSLLTRPDLDRRLGTWALGPYLVQVQRPERTLYRIALARADAAKIEDLATVVYRPEDASAP